MIKIIFILISFQFQESILSQNKIQSDTQLITDTENNVGKQFLFSNSKSLKMEQYNSQSLKGKCTLINFWFSTCEPCIAEFGFLNKIYDKYKTNDYFKLISFTFESPVDALKTAKKYSINYPIICISKDKCYDLNFNNGFPTNIITDSSGKVAYIIVGSAIDPKEVEKDFDNAIVSKIENLLKK